MEVQLAVAIVLDGGSSPPPSPGNPLQPDILSMVNEVNRTSELLTFLLDNLTGVCVCVYVGGESEG